MFKQLKITQVIRLNNGKTVDINCLADIICLVENHLSEDLADLMDKGLLKIRKRYLVRGE